MKNPFKNFSFRKFAFLLPEAKARKNLLHISFPFRAKQPLFSLYSLYFLYSLFRAKQRGNGFFSSLLSKGVRSKKQRKGTDCFVFKKPARASQLQRSKEKGEERAQSNPFYFPLLAPYSFLLWRLLSPFSLLLSPYSFGEERSCKARAELQSTSWEGKK